VRKLEENFGVTYGPSGYIIEEELLDFEEEKIEDMHKSLHLRNRPAFGLSGYRVYADLTNVEGAWIDSYLGERGISRFDEEPLQELAESVNLEHGEMEETSNGFSDSEILLLDVVYESYPGHKEFREDLSEVKNIMEEVTEYLKHFEDKGSDW
jgi:hypothetical protein